MRGSTPDPSGSGRKPGLVPVRAAPPRIGPYRVLRTVDRGGMAEIYEVEDPTNGQRYALKLLVATGTAIPRFNREYAMMTRLNHPNVARVYAFGEQGGQPWMTLEYLDGVPVGAAIETIGPVGDAARTREALRVGHDLFRALHHLHAHGLVHRDVKPGNVLILPDGRVKLIDFGIAYAVDEDPDESSREFLGTLAYAAPEQFRREPPVTSSDLYAAGALLYRLLTGRRPFTADSPAEMARLHLKATPPRLRSYIPDLAPGVEKLVLQCLRKTPEERPPDASVVADALADLLDGDVAPRMPFDLDRTGRRAVGREAELRDLAAFVEEATAGALVVIEGLVGSRRGDVVRLLVDEYRTRELPVVEIRHDDPERFGQLEAVAAADQRTLVVLWDLHRWDRGSTASLLRARDRARDTSQSDGAVFVADRETGTLWSSASPAAELRPDRVVHLGPLDVAATARLVGALLHRRPPPAAIARAIRDATGGVPAFVEDVVGKMLQDNQLIDVTAGAEGVRWAWRTDARVPVPDGARWQVLQALTSVDSTGIRILEGLAIEDRPMPLSSLVSLAGLDPSAATRSVGRLEAVGLVHISDDADPILAWTRSYVARMVRDRTPETRARALARRALDRADDTMSDPVVVRLALAAGRVDAALGPAIRQARYLLDRGAPASALTLLEPLLPRLDEARDAWPDEVARVHLAHAEALIQLRPTDPAVGHALGRVAVRVETHALRAEHALALARHHRALARPEEAQRHIGEAWSHATNASTPGLAAIVAHEAGCAYMEVGQIAWGRRWFDRAHQAADLAGDAHLRALSNVGRAMTHWLAAELGPAHDLARDAAEAFAARGDDSGLSHAVPLVVDVLRLEGRYTEALRWVRRFRTQLEMSEAPALSVRLLLAHARVEIELGRLGWAQDSMEAIHASLTPGQDLPLQLEAAIVDGRLSLASGDAARAAAILSDAASRAERAGYLTVARRARAAHGEALAAQDNVATAEATFTTLLDRVRGSGDALSLVEIAVARARALGDRYDPIPLAAPIRGWPDFSRARTVRVELLLARARWLDAQLAASEVAWREARAAIDGIRQGLGAVERSALAVHRWQRILDSARG